MGNAGWRLMLCVALLLAVASIVAGCGSGSSSSSSSGSTAQSEGAGNNNESGSEAGGSTVAAEAGEDAQTISDSEFSQANPEKAEVDRTGETIDLGYTNDESGPIAIPAFRAGSEAAVAYINENGGVNGAPIKLDVCLTEGTPESSINCANKFVENHDAVYVAGLDLGSDAVLPIIKRAGIPYVSSNDWGSATKTEPNAHILETGAATLAAASFEVMRTEGIESVSIVQYGGPSGEEFVKASAEPLGKTYGIQVFSDLANPTAPDWASAVQAASARGAQAILGYNSEQGCTQTIQGAQQVAFQGLVIAGSCNEFVKTLGEAAVGVDSAAQVYQPEYASAAPQEIQQNMATYEKAMKAAGQEKYIPGYATWGFSTMMELRSILETIPKGPIDGPAVAKAFETAKSTPGFLGPRLHCASKNLVPGEPTDCRDNDLPVEVVNEGGEVVQKPVYSGNGFITPEQ